MSDVAVCCEADFGDVAKASHLERFETADLGDAGCPAFGTVEKCCKGGCFEDSDFRFDGDF